MATRDLQQIKEEVRHRTDIVSVISDYTRLKAEGKNFKGLCPFHNDKKPSFSVTPAFQSYRCWSCGEKGDVFTFVQKKENLTFMEALQLLARRAGVAFEFSGLSHEQITEREEMCQLNSLALQFYKERAARSTEATEYLNSRKILRETQERFDIGYAPPDWDGLASYLYQKRANQPLAVKIGLLRERKEGTGYVDYYRSRVMFPIHDLHGNVVGFGGRTMGDDQPKYLNSPQSEIFNKSRLLYGLYFARQRLGQDTPPVFVEGYTDVVTAHQAGFGQCVATLGTAMTEDHAQMLVKYSRRVVLCYDSDAAGISATLKGAAIWDSMKVDGAELLVARLPDGEDPDSLLRRGDSAAFQHALDTAIPRIDFQIELIMARADISTENGREQALNQIIPVLATIQKRSTLDRYVQQSARLHAMYHFNVTRALESILADVSEYRRRTRNATNGRTQRYASVELINGQPLQDDAPPPQFERSDPASGGGFNPNTKNWTQARGGNTDRSGWENRGRKNEPPRPPSDKTPPSLGVPALSAADKAERTLLRALFYAEWRNHIVQYMSNDLFSSNMGRELAAWIISTPPREEGEINAGDVLNRIESGNDHNTEYQLNGKSEADMLAVDLDNTTTGNHSAKMSEFIRDVIEESASALSKEPLNEATVNGCIRRLRDYRNALAIRELKETLERKDLTIAQRETYFHRLMELTRAQRGTQSGG